MASARTVASLLFVAKSLLLAQAYTCPERPTWSAAACSFHRAFTPGETLSRAVDLREGRPHDKYSRYVLEIPLAPNMEFLLWDGHYGDNGKVARMMADAIATLPPIVLRSLPENTLVSMDVGSSGGAIYWDLPDERAHAIEFKAAFAHPYADTMDWSFEELLLHEIAHVFDRIHGISARPGWRAAVRADGQKVTRYAASNSKEDFAESFTAWAAVRADSTRKNPRLLPEHYRQVESTMRHRMDWLDGQLLDAAISPSGRLFHGLGWSPGAVGLG